MPSKTYGDPEAPAASDLFGAYGVTKVVQPSGTGQAAITDSTGGTPGNAAAAGVGVRNMIVPLTSLATGLSTAAIDLLTAYTPGYAFKLLSLNFVTTVAGTGTSASQVFNLTIGSTATTGGVLTLTLASQATIGVVTAATAITALNTGTASDTFSIKMAASGTVFTAGAGYFVIKIQNMDTVNAISSILQRTNKTRTDMVALGWIAGA